MLALKTNAQFFPEIKQAPTLVQKELRLPKPLPQAEKPEIETTSVWYDDQNLDSLLAFAMLVHAGYVLPARSQCYQANNEINVPPETKTCLLLGVELPMAKLQVLLNNAKQVKIYSYATGYQGLRINEIKKLQDRLSIHWPTKMDGLDFLVSDNNICDMIRRDYPQTMNTPFHQFVMDTARYVNLLPEMKQSNFPIKKESSALVKPFKAAMLYDLKKGIQNALASVDPYQAIVKLQPKLDINAYLTHHRQLRIRIQRDVEFVRYGKAGQSVVLPTMNIDSELYLDALRFVLYSREGLVGYMDSQGYRTWRVYCKNSQNTAKVVQYLKPREIWHEGCILCHDREARLPSLSFSIATPQKRFKTVYLALQVR